MTSKEKQFDPDYMQNWIKHNQSRTTNKNKEEQKRLLIEIMQADEKDGLYEDSEPQTPVEWLLSQDLSVGVGSGIRMKVLIPEDIIEKAKQMEKEDRREMYRLGREDGADEIKEFHNNIPEEDKLYQEYMKGYQQGWRECDEQIKNDIKILYNKYNLGDSEDKTFKKKSQWSKVEKKQP